MDFFDYLLAPFDFIIEQLFLLSYRLTGNYGVSVILLSFAISLLLLPIFILIERARKRDDTVKQKMKPLLDEIRRCYTGQERYYYIRTLHRQHGYNSFRALVPILTLLLQIPFFIAAYRFLDYYEPLAGQGFLMIDDLSAPDRLLGGINLLPIIMTLVNLVTAYFYTRNGATSERRQMLVVAGVFLLLLYNFPSGLVLYWTMNNVFSFFRLFITHPDNFRSTYKLSHKDFDRVNADSGKRDRFRSDHGIGSGKICSTIVWKNFHERVSTLALDFKKPFRVFLGLIFITAYFYFGSKYYYGGINKELGIIAFTAMLITQVAGLILYIKHFRSLTRTGALLTISALSLLTVLQGINLVSAVADKEIAFSIFNLEMTLARSATVIDVVLPGIIFIILIAFTLYYTNRGQFQARFRPDWSVYILSILYLAGFIFLWNPLAVFASYPSNFDFTAFDILKNNMDGFLTALAFLTAIYFSFSTKIRNTLLIIMTSSVVIGFIHNTIAPIEMGTLQETVFLNQENLAKPVSLFIAECTGILFIIYGITWLFRQGVHKQIRFVLIALNVILITQGLVTAGRSGSFFQQQNIPSNPTSSVSFSKDGQNIVLLVLDMFHGWYVNKIIEEDPELKNIYEGFVWYPNTLSVSSITGSSIGAMLGGYQYTIDKLNQDAGRPLKEKITDITSGLNTKLMNNGYGFSGNRIIYTAVDSLNYERFLPKWHEDWDRFNSQLHIGLHKEINYDLLWNNATFYSVPLIFKPRIYNKGQWLLGRIKKNQNTSRTKPYNFIRLLPHISDTESARSNFIYLYGSATHHPWDIIDDNGVLHTDVSPYENNKWALETLSSWIDWMKNNEVYDNTKIIIVSDHGPHWWYYKGEVDTDIPVIPNTEVKRINELSMGLFALLMVKDFDKKGEMREDWRFMSNADVHSIILSEDDPTTSDPPLQRTLPSSVVLWERKLWELNQLRIIKQFEVTENMYDLNNWKIVD